MSRAAPSFDCATARKPVERAICADPELASEDKSMAELFRRALEVLDATNAQALRADQRGWLADHDIGFRRGDRDLKVEMNCATRLLSATIRASNDSSANGATTPLRANQGPAWAHRLLLR